ncbi:hypothetical protein HDU85_004604 [Gaertneriomyces sp. JEL0708]|nr:hypothetical protein HDU85_004604 [Gaertneriomyces sp. JEL0708]
MGVQRKKRSLPRHDPLHVQIAKDTSLEVTAKKARPQRKALTKNVASDDDSDMPTGAPEGQLLDSKTSQRILNIVRTQQEEIEREYQPRTAAPKLTHASRFSVPAAMDSDEEEEIIEMTEEDFENFDGYDDLGIDEADAAIMEKFMTKEPKKQLNLSELIMSKIAAAEAGEVDDMDRDEQVPPTLNPKVVEVYSKVGLILSRYRSGKLPKTFKIIPSLNDWEEVLYLTRPDKWTPQATYQATRIFVSNLKAQMAQRFFALILLDRVRDDIAETKKLNYHLYMALKKALYKPGAFFKGILLPLCESGTCTLREAAIIGSVLTKVSVPLLHSAATLLKLAEMEYSGANSLFIRILLDKKYALPYKVIDSLVWHFSRFRRDERDMPVLWHQSLLVFAQRYKEDMTPEQKELLLDLTSHKSHPSITPEIRRELQNSKSRDEMMDVAAMIQ